MKRKNGNWAELFQILLSIGIIVTAVFLILDWKTYDFCFTVIFGLAAVLFFVRGVCVVVSGTGKKTRFGAAAAYFLVTTGFVGMFTGSILTMFFL